MGDEPYLGELRLFCGDFAPVGWLTCSGQLLPISQYDALYAVIGTQFGGDGVTTFGLPDLRGRTPICPGNQPNTVPIPNPGQTLGSEEVQLAQQEMAAHTHAATATANAAMQITTQLASQQFPSAGAYLGAGYFLRASEHFVEDFVPSGTSAEIPLGGVASTGSINIGAQGASQAHENMQPWVALTYIIAVEGLFPPQQ